MRNKELNRAVASVSVVCLVVSGIHALQQNAKDAAEPLAKLKRIGAALKIYREEFGYKPPAERKDFSDCGLPVDITVLTQPGKRWSVPMSDFQLSYSRHGDLRNEPEFVQLYWHKEVYDDLGDISRYFSERGEELPILIDEDFNKKLPEGTTLRTCPVLRLDGTVGWMTYDVRDWPGRLGK